jgi:putative transposase
VRRLRAELAEFSGEAEHVRLLVNFLPTVVIFRLVNSLKSVSSRRLRLESPGLCRHCWPAKHLCLVLLRRIGRRSPIPVLRQYIEQQKHPARPAH